MLAHGATEIGLCRQRAVPVDVLGAVGPHARLQVVEHGLGHEVVPLVIRHIPVKGVHALGDVSVLHRQLRAVMRARLQAGIARPHHQRGRIIAIVRQILAVGAGMRQVIGQGGVPLQVVGMLFPVVVDAVPHIRLKIIVIAVQPCVYPATLVVIAQLLHAHGQG